MGIIIAGRKIRKADEIIMKLKHGSDPDWMFNKTQLKMGIKTEMEHTDSKSIAKKIAKAHLTEFPNYYTKLRRAGL